ncbi:MAG: hypothetical protein H0T75_04465 [Rhizobiales bacterium]|nr:hypothetical protein [Hyphomicrobiales bacterium]
MRRPLFHSGDGRLLQHGYLRRARHHGIAVPRTYTEFVAACEKLKAAGVLPIAAGGASGSGWALEISLGVIHDLRARLL